MSTSEVRTLTLGGNKAAVKVKDKVAAPQEHAVTAPVADMTAQLFSTYNKGTAWPKESFFGRSGPEILQSVRMFCHKVNHQRSEQDQPILNVLELEEVVKRQSVSLALPLQNLCAWTVLVRVGVRKLQRDLLGLVSMIPMPPRGAVKLNRPADNVGKTHFVVTHMFGERFLCRGYSMSFNDKGEWLLGGPEGNRWFKDLWLTPGLQAMESLMTGKRRKLLPHGSKGDEGDTSRAHNILTSFGRKLKESRAAAGMDAKNFGGAYGARLDLENKDIMLTALTSIRALLAQVVVYQEDARLDDIVGRAGRGKAEIIDDPSLAGDEEASFRHHLQRRSGAYQCFRACGSFALPRGYMVFAEQGIPKTIPQEARTELTGVSGTVVSAEYLSQRYDVPALRRNPATLPEVEDLTPLIDACGVSTISGKLVEDMELISKDPSGAVADDGELYMRYKIAGYGPQDIPLADFLRRTAVRFVPMVVNFHRRRLFTEDLQGERDGIAWAMSFDDVNPRFRSCPKKKSNCSRT